MNGTLLYKWKKKSLKFWYSFFSFSDNPGMSFSFFMPVFLYTATVTLLKTLRSFWTWAQKNKIGAQKKRFAVHEFKLAIITSKIDSTFKFPTTFSWGRVRLICNISRNCLVVDRKRLQFRLNWYYLVTNISVSETLRYKLNLLSFAPYGVTRNDFWARLSLYTLLGLTGTKQNWQKNVTSATWQFWSPKKLVKMDKNRKKSDFWAKISIKVSLPFVFSGASLLVSSMGYHFCQQFYAVSPDVTCFFHKSLSTFFSPLFSSFVLNSPLLAFFSSCLLFLL